MGAAAEPHLQAAGMKELRCANCYTLIQGRTHPPLETGDRRLVALVVCLIFVDQKGVKLFWIVMCFVLFGCF